MSGRGAALGLHAGGTPAEVLDTGAQNLTKLALSPNGSVGRRGRKYRHSGTMPHVSLQYQEPVTRWYYLGPMFRYERMKKGRYRSFWQLGVEAYGLIGIFFSLQALFALFDFGLHASLRRNVAQISRE